MKKVRGFRDLYEEESDKLRKISSICLKQGDVFGCEYVVLPTVEYNDLFERSMQSSDIVRKELIRINNSENNQSLRPEGTASTIRQVIERGVIEGRFMYCGSFFRNERPQKGRYREFYQFGVEMVSARKGACEELDMFMMIHNIMNKLNISYIIKINNIGTHENRLKYESVLKEYVERNIDKYSDESKFRLYNGGIFRILDSKNDMDINKSAPQICEYIDSDSRQELDVIVKFFQVMNISYEIDPFLVRGLDYYAGNVFEIISKDYIVDSCHTAIGGGGRYDGLARQLGSRVINRSVGFALGLNRLSECCTIENESLPFLKVIMTNIDSLEKLKDVYKNYSEEYIIITVLEGEKISKNYNFTKVIKI